MSDVAVPQTAPPRSARVVYADTASDFRKLVWRGAGLELITGGFYRFWLATDMRRHLWAHTSIEGDSLEYTGSARELLLGFLFALAILIPIYLVYFLLGIEAERYQAFASVPFGLFLYLFFQFAIFRARRYRASRTVWRGVRFWMTGSGWLYALRASLWGLLALITLGVALPWREAALERYKMRHTHYGDLPVRFEATGWELFKKVWWLWLVAIAIFPLLFVYPMYKAATWRWWISGIRVGAVRCESDLRTGALIGLYWAVMGWSAVIMLVEVVVVGILGSAAAFIIGKGSFDTVALAAFWTSHTYVTYACVLLNYLVLALAAGAVIRIYLLRRLWQKLADSTALHNLEGADNVMAKGSAANALGEGFANSLDIAGF